MKDIVVRDVDPSIVVRSGELAPEPGDVALIVREGFGDTRAFFSLVLTPEAALCLADALNQGAEDAMQERSAARG